MTARPKEERQILNSRLKEARSEMHMKQEQVARALKVPVSAISAMEHGHRKIEAQELFFLSQLYKRPMEWFFTRHPEVDSDPMNSGSSVDNLLIKDCVRLLIEAPEEQRRSAIRGLKGFLQ